MYRADLINAEMGKRRMSGEELAEKAKLNPNTISAIRNGKSVAIPTLQAVADVLSIEMKDLFTFETEQAA